jgi:protein-tyrosine phosphatase
MSGPAPLFRVLIVCTGNTCRSPLAEVALRRALGELAPKVEIRSAGTGALDGTPASSGARGAAKAAGLDLEGHTSRRLSAELLDGVDLVLLMDPRDRARVRALDPEAADQAFGLAGFGRPESADQAIPDPFGGSAEEYRVTLQHIDEHLARVVPYIRAGLRERETGAQLRSGPSS